MTVADKERFLLTEDDSDRIFGQLIAPELLESGEPRRRPVVVLLGGQPGSGKSRLKAAVLQEFQTRGGAVGLDGDDLRAFHPRYRQLLKLDDRQAAYYTDLDAGRWLDKAMRFSINGRVNVVLEGTMRRPGFVRTVSQQFRKAGYRVEVAMVAADGATSRLGILQRYLHGLEASGCAHYTPREIHDAGYAGLLESADMVERERLADAVAVYARSGAQLYANHVTTADRWANAPGGLRAAIEAERSRGWTFDATVQFLRDHSAVTRGLGAQWLADLRDVRVAAEPLMHPDARIAVQDQAGREHDDATLAGEADDRPPPGTPVQGRVSRLPETRRDSD